jgi:uncharacterized membrane protein YfcA
MLTIMLFFVVAFIAAVVASVAGFGTATMTVPFLAMIVGLKAAIPLIATFHGFSGLWRLVHLRQMVNWRLMLLYGIPSVITAYLGARLFLTVSVEAIGLGVGIFLILWAIYSIISPRKTMPEKPWILTIGGCISGFTAGLIGLGGAIRGAFLVSTKIKKETFIATSAAIALVTDVTRVTTYVVQGSIESQYYWYIPVFFVVGFAGSWVGVRQVLRRIPELAVKRVVMVALILVSINFILGYFGMGLTQLVTGVKG